MNIRVADELVAQYAAKVRAGESTKELFPARMSECDFTPSQRDVIRKARADRKAAQQKARQQPPTGTATKPAPPAKPTPSTLPVSLPSGKGVKRLRKLLYLQSNRCFFCSETLRETEASVEHLTPKSRGGTNAEGNLVACHKSLNQVFGDMDLKSKFAFILRAAGKFKCP